MTTGYKYISYGVNINIPKKKIDTGNGDNIFQQINLSKSNGKVVTMVGCKDECLKLIPNIIKFSSCLSKLSGKKKQKSIEMSGKLVLFIAVEPRGSTQTCVNKIWNKDDFIMARKCKPNIMESFNHHGSIGYYCSFGNKANYGIVDKSSVGVYSDRKTRIL